MPWNEPGDNQKDPWTGKKRGSDNGAEDIIKKLNQTLGSIFNSGGGSNHSNDNKLPNPKLILLGLVVVGAIWLSSGFYVVDARQQALVLRFGEYIKTVPAGLNWHLPYPIESVEIVEVEQNRSTQDRSTMLTKDENIVDIVVSVQYKVRNAEDYAFNIKDVDAADTNGTLYQVMRGATREIIGRNDMDFILREGREQIAVDTQNLMQKVLDSYKSGLQVIKVNLTYAEAPEKVKDAFDDANRAREDANRFKNEAETYAKRVVPEANGRAARLLEEANAKSQEAIAKAEGDASRFLQLMTEYQKAPEVTRQRLYIESMESVLNGGRKIIVDTKQNNNLMYLPLEQLTNTTKTEDAKPAPVPEASTTPPTTNAPNAPAAEQTTAPNAATPAARTENFGIREGR